MLNARRRRVLKALVEEYVVSAQPVGSKTLVARHELGCSPATVRNELAILEETGYAVQPHVSAGRLPTDSGYRDFVDGLLERVAERQLEPATLSRATEVDDLMRETSALLTRLTDSLAVVLAPSVYLARVKRLNLISMGVNRALIVLITDSGQVLNRHVVLPQDASPDRIAAAERYLNAALVAKRAADIRFLRESLIPREEQLEGFILDEILDELSEADRDRLYHVGVPALLAQPEFHDADRAAPLIECVENGLALLETLSEALPNNGITVRIGRENRREELGGVSVVAIHYGAGNSDGVVGVIGPTRMNYERAIEAVRTVADGLSSALS